MSSIWDTVSAAIRKVVLFFVDLAPSPPADESTPPDIDGRRPSEGDTTAMKVDLERKDGRGGYR
jgi:hypothetical protein